MNLATVAVTHQLHIKDLPGVHNPLRVKGQLDLPHNLNFQL